MCIPFYFSVQLYPLFSVCLFSVTFLLTVYLSCFTFFSHSSFFCARTSLYLSICAQTIPPQFKGLLLVSRGSIKQSVLQGQEEGKVGGVEGDRGVLEESWSLRTVSGFCSFQTVYVGSLNPPSSYSRCAESNAAECMWPADRQAETL